MAVAAARGGFAADERVSAGADEKADALLQRLGDVGGEQRADGGGFKFGDNGFEKLFGRIAGQEEYEAWIRAKLARAHQTACRKLPCDVVESFFECARQDH